MQHTLARPFRCAGVGLHGGRPAAAEVCPAAPYTGLVFVVGGARIPATVDHVVDTRLATTLGLGGARVSMVEHLCAALYAAGVDNAEIHVDGDELPVLDGSARLWCVELAGAGIVAQGVPAHVWAPAEPVTVRVGDSEATLFPAPRFELDLHVDFAHPCIGRQAWAGPATGETFVRELAWARTFGFLRDAEPLRRAGLARGASLENTVVYDDAAVMNPGGLRAPDEAVRHKALDAVGDVALLGARLHGRLVAHRAGHAVHVTLLRHLRERMAGALGPAA